MKKLIFSLAFVASISAAIAQTPDLAPTPPMGWNSWNQFGRKVDAQILKKTADTMVANGMAAAGYQYICIDDCWSAGRDKNGSLIPDPKKFPQGMKAVADYVHSKGLKLGIYSDAAPKTCAGFEGSYGHEDQDARTFASWGIDYLKYDYCGAPADVETAKKRYHAMAEALRKCGRPIVFSICEWGNRKPWLWAAGAGGQLWRSTGDIRDKWEKLPGKQGQGIMDNVNINAELPQYAGPGRWNDPDLLVIGLYGKGASAHDLGGIGCTDTEYQSQMSLWCLMASPLLQSCDLSKLNDATKRIILNKDAIAIDQDPLGKQATRKVNTKEWNVFVKPLQNGNYAVGVLNLGDKSADYEVDFSTLGIPDGFYKIEDVWTKQTQTLNSNAKLPLNVASHETKLLRLSK